MLLWLRRKLYAVAEAKPKTKAYATLVNHLLEYIVIRDSHKVAAATTEDKKREANANEIEFEWSCGCSPLNGTMFLFMFFRVLCALIQRLSRSLATYNLHFSNVFALMLMCFVIWFRYRLLGPLLLQSTEENGQKVVSFSALLPNFVPRDCPKQTSQHNRCFTLAMYLLRFGLTHTRARSRTHSDNATANLYKTWVEICVQW